MKTRRDFYIFLALFLVQISACSGGGLPPVADHSPVFNQQGESAVKKPTAHYRVRAGDTLYSIAWRFQKDFKDIAAINRIRPPYVIQPGQQIELRSGPSKRVVARPAQKPKVSNPANKPVNKKGASNKRRAQSTLALRGPWHWPAKGKVSQAFGKYNAGVDIRIPSGGSVSTAAQGEVVYAGQGLRGFKFLIIIKHSEQILSAYGLNQAIYVTEGQKIKVGAKLADIKNTGVSGETLHFEIRKNGNPVNPGEFIKAQH